MNKPYVIFADHDAAYLELTTRLFKRQNPETGVMEFTNGKEVISFLEEFSDSANPPALIMLDSHLPLMDGKETISVIRNNAQFKYIPLVLSSLDNNAKDKAYCNRYDASFLNKPATMEGLKEMTRILATFCSLYA